MGAAVSVGGTVGVSLGSGVGVSEGCGEGVSVGGCAVNVAVGGISVCVEVEVGGRAVFVDCSGAEFSEAQPAVTNPTRITAAKITIHKLNILHDLIMKFIILI